MLKCAMHILSLNSGRNIPFPLENNIPRRPVARIGLKGGGSRSGREPQRRLIEGGGAEPLPPPPPPPGLRACLVWQSGGDSQQELWNTSCTRKQLERDTFYV